MINKLEKILSDKNSQKQFVKYIFVGGSSAISELGIFTILRTMIELDISISNIMATTIATIINFILNRGWAFNNDSNLSRSLVLYLCLFFLNMTFSTWFIGLLVNVGIWDLVAKFTTMAIVTIWNFIFYKKIIFK